MISNVILTGFSEGFLDEKAYKSIKNIAVFFFIPPMNWFVT